MHGKFPKCSNKMFIQSSFICPSSSKWCQFFTLQTTSEDKKFLAQFNRLAFQSAVFTRWNVLNACITVYTAIFSNIWQVKCSEKYSFSATSLCKPFEKQADKNKTDSFALLEEWLSYQQRQNRSSWFQRETACCCCLNRFYHPPLWLKHFWQEEFTDPAREQQKFLLCNPWASFSTPGGFPRFQRPQTPGVPLSACSSHYLSRFLVSSPCKPACGRACPACLLAKYPGLLFKGTVLSATGSPSVCN